MKCTARQVAQWLLIEAQRQHISLTHMQLQKLLYYAQGYSLGMTGEPLFEEAIEAWQHGPVVPNVYNAYRQCGDGILPVPQCECDMPSDIQPLIASLISEKGSCSATQLRNMTHSEDPWRDTAQLQEITKEKLEKYFESEFWTSDEEDEYQPYFDTQEEERLFFLNNVAEEDRLAILGTR